MAWTRTLALGLLFGSIGLGAQACVVSVDDDPDDGFGGDGGTLGLSGRGGSSGNDGRSGSGGGTLAGSGGNAGDGTGGTDTFFVPTCDEEPGDETDECARCLKQNCCTPWLGCDDETCAIELIDVSECVQSIEFPTTQDLGMCISDSSTLGDGFVQENTQSVIDCALEPADDAGFETTLCSTECFGSDIFPE